MGRIHRFGNFELDEAKGELRRDGKPVAMQPKPFELLLLLARERDRVVSQDELFDALWPDTAVTPASLNRAVSHARRAIGDTGKGEWIKSIARRGYRFCAPVVEDDTEVQPESAAPPEPAPAREPFVGREEALQSLLGAWDRAAAGSGCVSVLRGPPGIGKSRLAQEFVDRARARGATVAIGRGRAGEGIPPLWIWVPVLRDLARRPTLSGALGSILSEGDQFAQWTPELADRIADARGDAPVPEALPAERRFQLYQAAARSLVACAAVEPLLIVLEDLHWAGNYALQLLEHAADDVAGCRAMILVTARDESGLPEELPRTLGVLRAQPGSLEIRLESFTRGEVAQLLNDAIGRRAPTELTSEVHARTEGVPLYVREAIRLLSARGDLTDPSAIAKRGVSLPMQAFDLVSRTIEALPSDVLALVSAGAIVGSDFSVPLVASILEVEREAVLDGIDRAIDGGVLEASPDQPGRFGFAHALFRDAAYERLSAGERVRLHHRVARRLEERLSSDGDAVLPELAHHLHQSLALADPERALEVALQAAARARALAADQQAAAHYEQALAALEASERPDAVRRLELLNELAVVYGFCGRRAQRRATAERAMDLAKTQGDAKAFARAAVAYCEIIEWSPNDPGAQQALHTASEMLGEHQSALAAKVAVRLSYLEASEPTAEARDRAAEALALARATGDADTIQEALFTRMYLLAGPDHFGERDALAEELARLAPQSGDRDPALVALIDSACDAIAEGDRAASTLRRASADAVAGRHPHEGLTWHMAAFDAGYALMEGRIEQGIELAERAAEVGRRISHPFANACLNGHLGEAHRWGGGFGDVVERLERGIGRPRAPSYWLRGLCGRHRLAAGDEGGARHHFEAIAREGFHAIPRDIRWLNGLAELAHLCADLGDDERADELVPLLKPVADLHGMFCIPIHYGGPIAGALARLEALRGHPERAVEHGRRAVAAAAALGARPYEMRLRRDLADWLGDGGAAEEAERERLAAEAIAEAAGLSDALRS